MFFWSTIFESTRGELGLTGISFRVTLLEVCPYIVPHVAIGIEGKE